MVAVLSACVRWRACGFYWVGRGSQRWIALSGDQSGGAETGIKKQGAFISYLLLRPIDVRGSQWNKSALKRMLR